MPDKAEQAVSEFYNTTGWTLDRGVTEDASRWEDLRKHTAEYVSRCRQRVLRHVPERGANMLDMASGPIQYAEYLQYSKGFEKRYCVDLSAAALEQARHKIGNHGVYLHGSFFDLPMSENFFDCTVSLHTIYHMDKDRQEAAVRKLLAVTKPLKPVIIVYSNPNSFAALAKRLVDCIAFRKSRSAAPQDTELYFHPHPLDWWNRFRDVAYVTILPWRSMAANAQKKLIPDNALGAWMLRILFALEDRFPSFFAKRAQYPMIVLRKQASRGD